MEVYGIQCAGGCRVHGALRGRVPVGRCSCVLLVTLSGHDNIRLVVKTGFGTGTCIAEPQGLRGELATPIYKWGCAASRAAQTKGLGIEPGYPCARGKLLLGPAWSPKKMGGLPAQSRMPKPLVLGVRVDPGVEALVEHVHLCLEVHMLRRQVSRFL